MLAPAVDAHHTNQEPAHPAISRRCLCKLNPNLSSSDGVVAVKGATQKEERKCEEP
jgi:hypothetical protein